MEDDVRSEIVEVDAERFITLDFRREWPKYVVRWAVKQRAGESDFPLADGAVDELPGSQTAAEEIWGRLREAAMTRAVAAVATAITARERPAARRSLLDRLLGR